MVFIHQCKTIEISENFNIFDKNTNIFQWGQDSLSDKCPWCPQRARESNFTFQLAKHEIETGLEVEIIISLIKYIGEQFSVIVIGKCYRIHKAGTSVEKSDKLNFGKMEHSCSLKAATKGIKEQARGLQNTNKAKQKIIYTYFFQQSIFLKYI